MEVNQIGKLFEDCAYIVTNTALSSCEWEKKDAFSKALAVSLCKDFVELGVITKEQSKEILWRYDDGRTKALSEVKSAKVIPITPYIGGLKNGRKRKKAPARSAILAKAKER